MKNLLCFLYWRFVGYLLRDRSNLSPFDFYLHDPVELIVLIQTSPRSTEREFVRKRYHISHACVSEIPSESKHYGFIPGGPGFYEFIMN